MQFFVADTLKFRIIKCVIWSVFFKLYEGHIILSHRPLAVFTFQLGLAPSSPRFRDAVRDVLVECVTVVRAALYQLHM
jgi:hypothetical protein